MFIMSVIINLWVITFTSIVIFFGNIFAESSSKIGDHFKLSKSVTWTTFDAVAISLPELFVALYAVIFFRKFEVGIGTISLSQTPGKEAGTMQFQMFLVPTSLTF